MPAGAGSSDAPRNSLRFALPSGMAHVGTQLELGAGAAASPLVGRLWDISPQGACIALLGSRVLVVPAAGVLLLMDPIEHGRHRLEVSVRWSTALSHTTFVGVLFSAGLLPRDSFLMQYMRRSWTDSVPRSRIQL
jgi:hypothetical protein